MSYTTPHVWVGGEVLTPGDLNILGDDLNYLQGLGVGTYSAYTPTWTSTGTAVALGNAVVASRYTQHGKLVHAYGSIVFGSTSTYGTGTYEFALPVAPAVNFVPLGISQLTDDSTTNTALAAPLIDSTSMYINLGATYLGAATVIGQLFPWTWATSDIVSWNIVYEAS